MYLLKTSAAFDSAHFLYGYDGKCANIHGHRWSIEVTVYGDELQQSGPAKGMIIDFSDIKHEVRNLADKFDHALIFEDSTLKLSTLEALSSEGFRLISVPFRPTAENFAKYFFDLLTAKGIAIKSVTVYETPDNCAVYEAKL